MKKVFISQPMNGLSDEEILREREVIKRHVTIRLGEEVEIIDSFMTDYPGEINKHVPVWYLGKSIQFMSEADVVFFGGNWGQSRGCILEYKIALAYGLEIMEMETVG